MARWLRRQSPSPENGQDATRRIVYTPVVAYTIACDPAAFTLAAQDATLTYTSSDTLIGRKYPRRGRSRSRKVVDIDVTPDAVTPPDAVTQIVEDRTILERELAQTNAELETARVMTHNGVNRTKQLEKLAAKVAQIEIDINLGREEEELLILLMMALEN